MDPLWAPILERNQGWSGESDPKQPATRSAVGKRFWGLGTTGLDLQLVEIYNCP